MLFKTERRSGIGGLFPGPTVTSTSIWAPGQQLQRKVLPPPHCSCRDTFPLQGKRSSCSRWQDRKVGGSSLRRYTAAVALSLRFEMPTKIHWEKIILEKSIMSGIYHLSLLVVHSPWQLWRFLGTNILSNTYPAKHYAFFFYRLALILNCCSLINFVALDLVWSISMISKFPKNHSALFSHYISA